MYPAKGHNLSSLKATKTFHRRECLDQIRFHRCNRSCEPCPRCTGRKTGNLVGNNVRILIRTTFITKYAGYDLQFVLWSMNVILTIWIRMSGVFMDRLNGLIRTSELEQVARSAALPDYGDDDENDEHFARLVLHAIFQP